MKIKRFIGRSVNGYLHLDINFFNKLTFVTGINGSGKTSALNSIAALLLPKLDYLATQRFEEIAIEIVDKSGKVRLAARKRETETILTCSRFPKSQFSIVEPDELHSVPAHRVREYEEEHYTTIISRNANNPVLHFIHTLPTPMYLGLDRRSLSLGPDRPRYRARSVSGRRPRRNVFGQSLEAGLSEALHFARQRYERDRLRELALDEKFRENLLLALIDFPFFSLSTQFAEPSKADLRKIEVARDRLERLPDILNVDKGEIPEKLNEGAACKTLIDSERRKNTQASSDVGARQLARF